MTFEALRRIIATMKGEAGDRLRAYGRILGVEEAFIDACVAALGEISLEEALLAMENEVLAKAGGVSHP